MCEWTKRILLLEGCKGHTHKGHGENVPKIMNFIRSQKGPTKPKDRTNSTKEFSEQFEGVTGHYPVKQGF